jgi:hypothetical protein
MVKMKAMVCGVGINDADYKVNRWERGPQVWQCPYYTTWKSMIERCYSVNNRKTHPSYEGSKVCDSWLRFSKFRKWMTTQQWIYFTDDEERNIIKKELDKDLLSGEKRGKIYSPETSVFLSRRTNLFLTDSKKTRGEYPLGVCKFSNNKYKAQVKNPFTKNKNTWAHSTLQKLHKYSTLPVKKD